MCAGPDLNQANPRRLPTLPALDDINNDRLPFADRGEPGSFKSRDVHKHVLALVVVPLGIKPFHRSGLLDQRIGRSGDQRQRLTRTPLTDRLYPQAPPPTTRQLNAPNASRCCLLGVTASGTNAAR